MPLGSSSAAPVISPGPSLASHETLAGGGAATSGGPDGSAGVRWVLFMDWLPFGAWMVIWRLLTGCVGFFVRPRYLPALGHGGCWGCCYWIGFVPGRDWSLDDANRLASSYLYGSVHRQRSATGCVAGYFHRHQVVILPSLLSNKLFLEFTIIKFICRTGKSRRHAARRL